MIVLYNDLHSSISYWHPLGPEIQHPAVSTLLRPDQVPHLVEMVVWYHHTIPPYHTLGCRPHAVAREGNTKIRFRYIGFAPAG